MAKRCAALGLLALGVLFATGCAGAGPYGHSPRYAQIAGEAAAAAGARDYDPVMVERLPDQWRKGKVSLFGVVQARSPAAGGQVLLKLGLRRLAPRNLCESENDDDSCRVTVSEKDFGVVYALVSLQGEDEAGRRAVGPRSLVRVIGSIGRETGPGGAPMVHADYYRHWPAFYYVTRGSAGDMRQ